MKLILTEKPQVAQSIAKVIGVPIQENANWYEGEGYYITWCVGHLVEIKAQEAEGRWEMGKLPIMPASFSLAPITDPKTHEPSKAAVHRLNIIEGLLNKSDLFIAATDAAREGELIWRRVYQYCGGAIPIKRLWISDLTAKSIKEGLNNLYEPELFDGLALAAEARAEADWLVGINCTRALTLANEGSKLLSLGRVQTSILKIICERWQENADFVSEPFWFLKVEIKQGTESFIVRGKTHLTNRDDAEHLMQNLKELKHLQVKEQKIDRKTENPPLLHDLASLQKAANIKYGYTASETLALAQKLYMKGFLSYPRVGTRFIPSSVYNELPDTFRALESNEKYGSFIKNILSKPLPTRSVSNTELTDHHALIVTNLIPGDDLCTEEMNIYNLVLQRMIESFSSPCVCDINVVCLTDGNHEYGARSRFIVSKGWRAVENVKDSETFEVPEEEQDVEDIEITNGPIPVVGIGEDLKISRLGIFEDHTKPKPLYTDATLITAMENAGNKVKSKFGVKTLAKIGIGTPATRSEEIETLVSRGYIERAYDSRKFSPTVVGLEIYEIVKSMKVSDVGMTVRWEIGFEDMSRSVIDKKEFMDTVRPEVFDMVNELKLQRVNIGPPREQPKAPDIPAVICPICGKNMNIYDKAVKCESCKTILFRNVANKNLTENECRQLIETGTSGVISGFRGRSGKRFKAILHLSIIDGEYELGDNRELIVKFDFNE